MIKLALLGGIIIFAAGCEKEVSATREQMPGELKPSKVFKTPLTPEEKLLVHNISKAAEVLKELYRDKSNLKLVNAAIYSKTYTDESVLLKDLIYPNISLLPGNAMFKNYMQQWNVSLPEFAKKFWEEVDKRTDPALKRFLQELNMNGVATRSIGSANANNASTDAPPQVSVYFPYSDKFFPQSNQPDQGAYEPATSIAAATADADEGWGNEPYYLNRILQGYHQVLVDDDYAFTHPTQIVGVNGIEPYDSIHATYSAFLPGDPMDLANLPREIKQVYVGDVRINGNQYDNLISFTGNGGGSEIRFTRADGFLKLADGQVTLADVYFTPAKEISRASIRSKNWVDFSLEWDGDWETSNLQQNLSIYEEDNRNSSEFDGQLSTTLKLFDFVTLTIGPIGFKVVYKSDDEIIRQLNYNRDVFFILNRTDLEGEIRNGSPVRDRNGPVSYTLKDRTYY